MLKYIFVWIAEKRLNEWRIYLGVGVVTLVEYPSQVYFIRFNIDFYSKNEIKTENVRGKGVEMNTKIFS